MGKDINENERLMVEATGEIIANKIRSTIIDAHKSFNIEKPSFPNVAAMLMIAIVDVVQDFADVHKISLTEEMEGFVDALMHAAKDAEELKNKKGEKEDKKEDGKE
jgi:hemoglobin-like flavoprotein